MKLVMTSAARIGLAVFFGGIPLAAQMQNNSEKQMTCSNGGNDRDRARHCEIREQSLPSIGRLSIDATPNGGATVKGWLGGDVLVRARVEASGETEGAAAILTSRVTIDGSGGQVRATGPEPADNSSWSVSYEIFVPQATDVTLKTTNGGLTISDVRGHIHFDSVNGGVHLKRVAGEVSGATVNGGIDVELTGATGDWRQMELSTHNGGVTVAVPANYSAHIQAETGMGRIQSDFPLPANADGRGRRLDFTVGSGGPPVHITTGNGGIRLKRSESQ
ncbi:MAG TPA: DUF4097 family beta strand repeat-containing protein [Candidatus Solibacter sp.]|nr:DUF4097 family beta strand repeat-containing protein [Candidatus Solibacter sp.]